MADAVVSSPAKGGTPTKGGPGPLRRLVTFYHDVMVELRKVTWPDRKQVQQATVGIIIFVLVFGLFIFLMDLVLQGLLVKLIPSLFAGG